MIDAHWDVDFRKNRTKFKKGNFKRDLDAIRDRSNVRAFLKHGETFYLQLDSLLCFLLHMKISAIFAFFNS